jgi:hypothetical protein
MVANKLTDTKIKAIKKPGIYGDGDGLFIRMHAGGSKSWFFIYTRDGKKRELGLGSLAGTAPVSLANARRKAEELRAMLAEGRDPHAERVASKAASEHTFQKVSEKFIAERSDWTPHTEREWKRHLLKHASALAEKAVADITTETVEEPLRPLWEKKPATGQRVRAKIESVLDYASVKKLRTGDNPARWAGHLEHLLTKAGRVTGANHKAMPYADVPGFLSTLGNSTIERLMRFIVLTAVRSGEGRLTFSAYSSTGPVGYFGSKWPGSKLTGFLFLAARFFGTETLLVEEFVGRVFAFTIRFRSSLAGISRRRTHLA